MKQPTFLVAKIHTNYYHENMSKKEKLIRRFTELPNDFTWQELKSLLKEFGYKEAKIGNTSGSRARFTHQALPPIILHRPHPGNEMKRYQLEQVRETLTNEGLL